MFKPFTFNVIIGGVVFKCTTWHLFLSLLCPLFLFIFLWIELNWGLCVCACVCDFISSPCWLFNCNFLKVWLLKMYSFRMYSVYLWLTSYLSCNIILLQMWHKNLTLPMSKPCAIVFTHYVIFFHNTLFLLYSQLFFKRD